MANSAPAQDPAPAKGRGTIGLWLFGLGVLIVFGALIWASDRISYQGERTIYTVQCSDGTWAGVRCNGRLVASDRYRFRASKSRQEVLHWIVGSPVPSGKYSQCTVKNRDNWHCRVIPGEPSTIIHAMADGEPVSSNVGGTPVAHAVKKWQWWLLKAGVPIVHNAEYF